MSRIYISYYNNTFSKLVNEFTHYLIRKFKYKISSNDEDKMRNSQLVLIFITKMFCETESCINEIKYIHETKKSFLVVMLEEISIDDLGEVAYYIINQKRYTAYKCIEDFQLLKGSCFDNLIKNINDELIEHVKPMAHSISTPDLSTTKTSEKKSSSIKSFFKNIFYRSGNKNNERPALPIVTPPIIADVESCFFKKIISKTAFKLKSNHLRRIALTSDKQKLLICDIDNKSIMCISLNGEYIRSHNPDNFLKGPCAICVDNKKKEIYVSDWTIDKIFVFNENFKLIRNLGEMVRVDTTFDLCLDSDTNYIFSSDSNNGVITVLDSKTGQLIKHLEINSPKTMRIFHAYLYVLSDNDNKSFILGINKKTFQETNMIRLTNLGMVRGMDIDEKYSNLYTTAYEKKENSIIWDSAAVFIFSLENGDMLNKIKLGITGIWDFHLYGNKMMIILEKENPNYLIEFEKS